jgi:glycosyltransferase involved in cell wall biosynthesis
VNASLALVVITDGRMEYLRQCAASLAENAAHDYVARIVVDDSGDGDHAIEAARLLDASVLVHHPQRRGLAAAVNSAFQQVLASGADYAFHVEEDFIFPETVPLVEMARLLHEHSVLAEMVLLRQPWSPNEQVVGGYLNEAPQAYTDRDGYLEHRRIFSLNPCMYPARTARYPWPAHGDEGDFTKKMVGEGYRFAVYGGRDDEPRCLHLGVRRSASWTV